MLHISLLNTRPDSHVLCQEEHDFKKTSDKYYHCLLYNKYDSFKNILVKFTLPLLSSHYSYISDAKHLVLRKIEIWLGSYLHESFTGDYLRASNNIVMTNNNDVYVNIPFQFSKKNYGFPYVCFTKHQISVCLYTCKMSRIINIKKGEDILINSFSLKPKLIVDYTYINSQLRETIAKTVYTDKYNVILSKSTLLSTDNLSHDVVYLYKKFLNKKLYPVLTDYICTWLDVKQDLPVEYTKVIKLEKFINISGLIITVTNAVPKRLLNDDNKHEYFDNIDMITLNHSNMPVMKYTHFQLYKLWRIHHNINLAENIAYIPFSLSHEIDGIRTPENMHISLRLYPGKYGAYKITVHYIGTMYVKISEQQLCYSGI